MIEITEILRQMKQGQTGPFLCEADDGFKYVVKGARATGIGRIREWLAGHLGKAFGLPLPDFALAYVDEQLVEFDSDMAFDLGSGYMFASRYVDNLQEVTYADLTQIDDSLLRDLYLFDYWVRNDDRVLTQRGGNPNVFIEQLSDQLVVLDHNLAFDPGFDLKAFRQNHIGARAWNDHKDLFVRVEYEARMGLAMAGFDDVIRQLPEEWFECSTVEDGAVQRIKSVLSCYHKQSFWEGIQ